MLTRRKGFIGLMGLMISLRFVCTNMPLYIILDSPLLYKHLHQCSYNQERRGKKQAQLKCAGINVRTPDLNIRVQAIY